MLKIVCWYCRLKFRVLDRLASWLRCLANHAMLASADADYKLWKAKPNDPDLCEHGVDYLDCPVCCPF